MKREIPKRKMKIADLILWHISKEFDLTTTQIRGNNGHKEFDICLGVAINVMRSFGVSMKEMCRTLNKGKERIEACEEMHDETLTTLKGGNLYYRMQDRIIGKVQRHLKKTSFQICEQ